MRLTIIAGTLALALALGACGGSGSGSPSGTTTSGATVAVKQVDGVGKVLVAANGMSLYTPAQEASGKILCTGACATVWKPLAPGAAKPSASGDTGTLAVLKRPDGTLQVTANRRPLYTFAQDAAGQVTGNGVADAFGSRHFTWHAVLIGGAPASGNATSGSAAGGSSGGNGGYGY